MSPAVNLDLEEVPFAILEAVKARILANRGRLLQVKPRPSTRPRPQFRKTGASTKGWRKPQHGAAVLGDDRGVAATHYFGSFYDENFYKIRIYSGDYSQYIEERIGAYSDDSARSEALFVLPVQNEICIVVSMYRIRRERIQGGSVIYVDTDFVDTVALCTHTTVRKLALPAPLASITNYLNPKRNAGYETIKLPDGSERFPPANFTSNTYNKGWVPAFGPGDTYSPEIYELLQKISPFVPATAIQSFPPDKPKLALLNYKDQQIYYLWYNPYDGSVKYADWLGDPDNFDRDRTDLLAEIPEATWYVPINNPYMPPSVLMAWDWDDPDYCRAMCLALGFTDADLTP